MSKDHVEALHIQVSATNLQHTSVVAKSWGGWDCVGIGAAGCRTREGAGVPLMQLLQKRTVDLRILCFRPGLFKARRDAALRNPQF